MTYTAPVKEVLFTLEHVAGMGAMLQDGLFEQLDSDLTRELLEQAGALAEGVLAPLNRVGDLEGVKFENGKVFMAPGFNDAYRQWAEGGWNGVAMPEEWGGAGLPVMLNAAVAEIQTAACMAFGLGPVLTQGASEALISHADDALKAKYLPKLVSGEWSATMNLTEPQAGSDLNLLRTKAEPVGDGTYKITGQKIFITCGDHDQNDNIIHLVLARLPDAPPGTKGISLFLVPKYFVNDDGSLGAANDLRCTGVEHKLGIHASPTCSMSFGDNGGAVGWLIGQENRGLNCMFTMMNRARLSTGLQGVAVAERAYQQALNYARDRVQGRTLQSAQPSPIIGHPDVRRMLLTMRALTAAARSIAYVTAEAIDRSEHGGDAAAQARADLLTPITKAFCTDAAIEVAELGVQIHGGMGFVEETGAAQHYRDVRITSIYEGTNSIQAIDLVTRKLPREGGACTRALIGEWRSLVAEAAGRDVAELGKLPVRMTEALDALAKATDWLLTEGRTPFESLAGASAYLRLFSLACGGSLLTKAALAALELKAGGDTDPAHDSRIATARFFAEHLAVAAGGLATEITEGGATLANSIDPFA